jgi:ferrous iron transport protein B
MKHFALAGNPNSGKTTLFNSLTGSTAHVGNWPGVTVDKKEGTYKKCAEPISIIDLPGIYSLSPYTPEEVISRKYILDEKPDCVINIVDATNLERNLYLTTQIMEIDVPMIVALNMMDEVEKGGMKIDAKQLEEKIGVPVVEISALKNKGLDKLMERAYATSKTPRTGSTVLHGGALMHLVNDVKIALEASEKVDNPLFHAIKLVEMDSLEVEAHKPLVKMVDEFKSTFSDDTFGNDFEALVADSRYKYISKNFSPVLTRPVKDDNQRLTKSDKVDKVLTHKIWGIPIFLVILFVIFHLTFSEDVLYLGAMGAFDKDVLAYDANGHTVTVNEDSYDENISYYDEDGNLAELSFDDEGQLKAVKAVPYVFLANGEKVLVENAASMSDAKFYADEKGKWEVTIEGEDGEYEAVFVSSIDEYCSEITANTFFGYEEGMFSPGVILFNALDVLTGLINTSIGQAIADANAAEWVSGLVCDGIFGGLFAILSFLPQILLLFLFFSILEDSGYMARVAFILDRIFRKFGVSGRAFMPMIMGFGCSIPAMINTRTLADERERTATIRVIPFFSCGAKLPILTAIAGGIVQLSGVGNADLITFGMYILGIVVAIAALLLMRNTTMRGEVPPFIMELPSYHAPQFKNLMIHLWDKGKHFVKKAFTIILASTIVIWFISHFSFGWEYLPDEQMGESILAGIGSLIQPLFTPLGFGSQLKSFGWVFVVAALTGLIAKENVIATFGTLAASITAGFSPDESMAGVDSVIEMINATGITTAGLIAFIAFNMLTIPCFAAVATAKAELPTKKGFNYTLLFWVVTSYVVATMIYLVGSWWWTVFIFLAIIAAAVTAIVFYNKKGYLFKKKAK